MHIKCYPQYVHNTSFTLTIELIQTCVIDKSFFVDIAISTEWHYSFHIIILSILCSYIQLNACSCACNVPVAKLTIQKVHVDVVLRDQNSARFLERGVKIQFYS